MRKLVIAGLVIGAIVAGGLHLTREPSSVELLEQANPGWTVAAASGKPVRVDDASGRYAGTTELVFTFRPPPP